MSADRSPIAPLVFDIDLAGPVDPPPVLFHTMRVPCACGRALRDAVYTFFPGSVFAHGVCEACGPRTAIFAPHMKDAREPLPVAVTRSLSRVTQALAREYGADPQTILAEFLNYLAACSDGDTGIAQAS